MTRAAIPQVLLPHPNHADIPEAQRQNNDALLRWSKTVSPILWQVQGLSVTTTSYIGGITSSGTTVTIFSTPNSFTNGEPVTVSGVGGTGAAYVEGTYPVYNVSASGFQYNIPTAVVGSLSAGGTAVGGLGQQFGIGTGGTPIPKTPSNAFLTQAGVQQVAFSGGLGTLVLPQPFPNGWVNLHLTAASTGSLVYFGHASSATTSNTIYISAATIESSTPQCRVYRAAAYTDSSSASTLCPFDTVIWDTNFGFNTSTHLYTVPVAGYYQVGGAWTRASSLSSGSAMQCQIVQNGTITSQGALSIYGASASNVASNVSDVLYCSELDTIGMNYVDFGGGGANTTASNCYMYIANYQTSTTTTSVNGTLEVSYTALGY